MREKSKQLLRNIPYFIALDGTAENTKLPVHSIDAIVTGQAFHWFDPEKTRNEFSRILKPNGVVVLMWNERLAISKFEKEYDQLIIKHARDYVKVDHRNIDSAKISEFFGTNPVKLKIFNNQQVFDYGGLEGRLLSSSYMPAKDDEGYKEMSADLKNLYERYQESGLISINYDTKVFVGRWASSKV
jgi:SAM-dependent methyltransferase